MNEELAQKLAGIDTMVFPDPADLRMMNLYAQSCGSSNYAEMISRIILGDAANAYTWLKTQAEAKSAPPSVVDLLQAVDVVEPMPNTPDLAESEVEQMMR